MFEVIVKKSPTRFEAKTLRDDECEGLESLGSPRDVIVPMNKMVMKIKLSIVEDILGFISFGQVVTYIDLHVALES